MKGTSMMLWIVTGFWLIVGGAAAYVTLFVPEQERAKHAFEVLKHVTRYGLGASAVAALAMALQKTGGVDLLNLISR